MHVTSKVRLFQSIVIAVRGQLHSYEGSVFLMFLKNASAFSHLSSSTQGSHCFGTQNNVRLRARRSMAAQGVWYTPFCRHLVVKQTDVIADGGFSATVGGADM